MGFLGSAAGAIAVAFLATAALAQTPAPAGEAAGQRLEVAANTNETIVEGALSGFATT